MTSDPYSTYLSQADALFNQGEMVKAGQIWQAILKQQPAHAEARQRLLDLRQHLLALREREAATPLPPPPATVAASAAPLPDPEPEPAPGPEPTPEPAPEPGPSSHSTPMDPDRLLAEGCTLYDMGQLEDALRKWDMVLAQDPNHALARGYVNGVRRELGRSPLEAAAAPAPIQLHDHHADEDFDKLLREAVQLYDMGLTEEAITKWDRALVLEPSRSDIEGYLRQARAELGETVAPVPTPSPAQPPSPSAAPANAPAPSGAEALDLKLRQAEHLLTMQRHEEAAFTFQQALGIDPGNSLALQGLMRCRKPSSTPSGSPAPEPRSPLTSAMDTQGRIAMAMEESPYGSGAQAVQIPETVAKQSPPVREGLSLPDQLRRATNHMPWLQNPKVIMGFVGGLVVLILGLGGLHGYRKDQALKEEVRAARQAAVAPLAEQTTAPDLAESPASLRQEAEATQVTDPLRAYLRAEALVARLPGDPAAAQLLEKSRAGLPGGVTGASLPEYQKHVQDGDLEAAAKVMDTLLRAAPSDANLRARAARLQLALCSAHAAQAKWDSAEEDLLRGRALFPTDKTWQVRLKLLEKVKVLPKEQRPAWITLLG